MRTTAELVAHDVLTGEKSVSAVIRLLEEKATVPFIARYRKEATGNLDEEKIILIRDRYEYYTELEKRKAFILKTLNDKKLLTGELEKKIKESYSPEDIEDLYLPFREGKKTRGKIAEEKGLKPLAEIIMGGRSDNPETDALGYIDPEKGLSTVEDVIAGCIDIVAASVNEDGSVRKALRYLFKKEAYIESKVSERKKEEGQKYRDYFSYSEKASGAPSHRVLAVLRGNSEKILSLRIRPDEEKALNLIRSKLSALFPEFSRLSGKSREIAEKGLQEGYQRLLLPLMENMMQGWIREKAEDFSISIFASALKELLLEPPYGNKPVIAVDPGIRTGSKVVLLDSTGNLAGTALLFCAASPEGTSGGIMSDKNKKGLDIIRGFIDKYKVEAAAVGNGTGSREISEYLKKEFAGTGIKVVTVSESGASVYSASEKAREEFRELDITFRGAVSIGRRFQDPLAELIKIDPQSIGVGQYQHDLDKKKLKNALDNVVTHCVNAVGVELNSAGAELLGYVSGIGKILAERIVSYRKENGPFPSRQEIRKVKGVGSNVFQQAAGFLRIAGGINPLDRSAVHPESYHVAEKIAGDLNLPLEKVIGMKDISSRVDAEKYIDDGTGLYTVKDIIAELERPGRDPRKDFVIFSYTEGIEKIEDLSQGMVLNGTVTNLTAFGAFVDIGVHQDGLVHRSMISEKYVENPSDFLRINQKVVVRVTDIDIARKRISLSIKDAVQG